MNFLDLFKNGTPSDYAVILFALKFLYGKIQERWNREDAIKKQDKERDAKEDSRKRIQELNEKIDDLADYLHRLLTYTVEPGGEGNERLKEALSLCYSNKEIGTVVSKVLDTNGPLSKQLDSILLVSREIYDRQTEIKGKIEAFSYSH